LDWSRPAGGFDIAKQLGEELKAFKNVEVQLETTAVGVYSDQVIGLRRSKEHRYDLIRPKHMLVAAAQGTSASNPLFIYLLSGLPSCTLSLSTDRLAPF
jgi:hypothetical protein